MWWMLCTLFFLMFFWSAYITQLPASASSVGWISTEIGFLTCAFLCLGAGLWTSPMED